MLCDEWKWEWCTGRGKRMNDKQRKKEAKTNKGKRKDKERKEWREGNKETRKDKRKRCNSRVIPYFYLRLFSSVTLVVNHPFTYTYTYTYIHIHIHRGREGRRAGKEKTGAWTCPLVCSIKIAFQACVKIRSGAWWCTAHTSLSSSLPSS